MLSNINKKTKPNPNPKSEFKRRENQTKSKSNILFTKNGKPKSNQDLKKTLNRSLRRDNSTGKKNLTYLVSNPEKPNEYPGYMIDSRLWREFLFALTSAIS
jgi:hypothetical protein